MFFKGLNAIVDNFVSSSHVLSLVCTRMHVEGDLEKLIFSPAQPGITRDIRGAWISVNPILAEGSDSELFEKWLIKGSEYELFRGCFCRQKLHMNIYLYSFEI